nr:hypothetical protein [Tanacetum cinerariifolium]
MLWSCMSTYANIMKDLHLLGERSVYIKDAQQVHLIGLYKICWRFKALMNELVNVGIKLSKLEINTGFINGLPKKWLKNLIDNIYDAEKKTTAIPFFLTSIFQDFQDSLDDEEDTRSNQEYFNDLEEEYQARALLAKSKRFFKKGSQRFIDFEANYNKVKAKLALLSFGTSSSKSSMVKNKCLVIESYESDEEDVSSDDNEMTEVKVLMALDDDENVDVGKESDRNGKLVKITMKKIHTLLDMEDNDERKSFIDCLCIDLNYVEEQRNNLVLKHRDLVQELDTCKERLLVLKQAKLNFLTMQHVNVEILNENQNLRKELKELTTIIETWLNSSNKVNQCISEQIPTQKKRILGPDQLAEDPSSSGQKD